MLVLAMLHFSVCGSACVSACMRECVRVCVEIVSAFQMHVSEDVYQDLCCGSLFFAFMLSGN